MLTKMSVLLLPTFLCFAAQARLTTSETITPDGKKPQLGQQAKGPTWDECNARLEVLMLKREREKKLTTLDSINRFSKICMLLRDLNEWSSLTPQDLRRNLLTSFSDSSRTETEKEEIRNFLAELNRQYPPARAEHAPKTGGVD